MQSPPNNPDGERDPSTFGRWYSYKLTLKFRRSQYIFKNFWIAWQKERKWRIFQNIYWLRNRLSNSLMSLAGRRPIALKNPLGIHPHLWPLSLRRRESRDIFGSRDQDRGSLKFPHLLCIKWCWHWKRKAWSRKYRSRHDQYVFYCHVSNSRTWNEYLMMDTDDLTEMARK